MNPTDTTLTISGDLTSALTHFAGWGLCAIVEGQCGVRPRVRWTDESTPRLELLSPLGSGEVAAAVHEHAQRLAAPNAWPTQTVTGLSHAGNALFGVRFKAPQDGAEWTEHFRQRDDSLPSANRGWQSTDDRFLTALGEPAWWRAVEGRSADEGASRWEMKTRNKGQEFLRDRFTLLAQTVSQRDPVAILDGLTGRATVDELGKGAADSRSATGLTPPGPVDNALAWCGLWGISAFPTFRQATGFSQSAAVWPRSVTHPLRAVLPVFTEPAPWAHARAVVASAAFDSIVQGEEFADQQDWLAQQGVVATVQHRILKTGSDNAPERQVLQGRVVPL